VPFLQGGPECSPVHSVQFSVTAAPFHSGYINNTSEKFFQENPEGEECRKAYNPVFWTVIIFISRSLSLTRPHFVIFPAQAFYSLSDQVFSTFNHQLDGCDSFLEATHDITLAVWPVSVPSRAWNAVKVMYVSTVYLSWLL
jgi:hypothetical protein